MRNGTPASRAATALRYVPTLLATSPLAAIRSAPAITTSTCPVRRRWPAALSTMRVCGTPPWPSSQVGERRALVPRSRLRDPDVDGQALREREVHGGEDRPELDAGEPAGVAVRQDLDRPAGPLVDLAEEREPRLADAAARRDVLVGHRVREPSRPRRRGPAGGTGASSRAARSTAHREVHRRRPRGGEERARSVERRVGRVRPHRERDAVRRRDADQGRSADLHRQDAVGRRLDRRPADRGRLAREPRWSMTTTAASGPSCSHQIGRVHGPVTLGPGSDERDAGSPASTRPTRQTGTPASAQRRLDRVERPPPGPPRGARRRSGGRGRA